MPLVAYVILNWNQAELTLGCLESLSKQDYERYVIIVVDNGSTDGSPVLISQAHSEVILVEEDENKGYSFGNNVGIQCALEQHADYVCLLNNDTLIEPTMLTQMVRVAQSDPQIGMVGPTMYYADPSSMIWAGANKIDWRQACAIRNGLGKSGVPDAQTPVQADYIDTCAILVKREVIEKIGLMNPAYFINFDDLDWNVRARRAGYKIVYAPAACMWHKVSAAMGLASPATTYYMTRNSLLFFSRNAPGIWRFWAPLRIMSRTLRTILAWSIKTKYHTETYRRKRDANVLALRDFSLAKFGKMGTDVARVCYDGNRV